MASPDLRTVTDALRAESRMWDRQSETLGKIHHAVEGMRINRVEAGIFQIFFSAYEDAVDQISARCSEGQRRMDEIASALVKNANAYDNNEEDVKKSVEGSY